MPAREMYAIYGASGHGRETMPTARAMLEQRQCKAEIVFVDDNPPGVTINGHRVLRYEEYLALDADAKYINVAIANHIVRRALANRCSADGIHLFDVIATNAVVLDDVHMEAGGILSQFAMLTSNIRVGRCFHANMYSYVAHDCTIGDYVTFAPSVKCNGNIVIEDDVYIGSGAVLRQGKPRAPLVVGRGAVIGMGAVVTESIAPGVTVVGNPARPLEKT